MPSSRARSDSTSGSSRYDTSSDSSGYSDEEDRSQRSGVRRGRRAAPSRSARGYRSLSKSQQGVEDAGSEISSSEEEKGELQARGPPKPRSNAPLILGAAIVLALLTLSGMALISYSFNKGESQATTRSSPSVASQAAASSPSSPSSARTTSPSSRSLASPASTAAFTSSAPSKTSSSAPSASSTSDNGYTALVAFGASYTDNAHDRADKYKESLREYYPYSEWGGRYVNGKVAVEWMVDSATSPALTSSASTLPKLLDYAYGGSVVKNGLSGTSSSSPAAVDQISQYLSDVKAGSASLGAGRVLHYFNSGINSQFQIWNAALSAGLSDSSVAAAKTATSAKVSAMGAAIRTIATDSTIASKAHGVDFLIVGIPPLEIVPTSAFQVPSELSDEGKAQALDLLRALTELYNSGLADFAAELKSEVSGQAFYFDLSALWYDLHKDPSTYGITTSPVSSTCYDSKTGSLCSDPSSYLYLDTLHPVTSVHALMAEKMNALVLGV